MQIGEGQSEEIVMLTKKMQNFNIILTNSPFSDIMVTVTGQLKDSVKNLFLDLPRKEGSNEKKTHFFVIDRCHADGGLYRALNGI